MKKATDEQIVGFIRSYCDSHGHSPSFREVCRAVGFDSPSSMEFRLRALREAGKVTFTDRIPRTLRATEGDKDDS